MIAPCLVHAKRAVQMSTTHDGQREAEMAPIACPKTNQLGAASRRPLHVPPRQGGSSAQLEGGGALELAVLVDAMRYLMGRRGMGLDRKERMAPARAWMASHDTSWRFAFENVCNALGIDPEVMRGRVLEKVLDIGAPRVSPESRRAPRFERARAHEIATMIRSGAPLHVVAEHLGIRFPGRGPSPIG